MRILIIAFYYPPEESWAKVASLRPASWENHWSKMGHQVYTLSDFKDHDKFDSHNTLRVKYWPGRPKHNLYSYNTLKSGKLDLTKTLRSFFRGTQNLLNFGSLFQSSIFWIYPAFKQALLLSKNIEFDVIISTHGPPANHIVASLLSRKAKTFWVADYRDLWSGNYFVASKGIFAFVEDIVEKLCVSQASLITTVSQELAISLTKRLKAKVVTVENGFELDDLEVVQNISWPDDKIRFLYTGSLYEGKQDPSPLFQALIKLKKSRSDLAQKVEVLFYGWNLDKIKEIADVYGLSDIVFIFDAIDRNEILSLQRSVDVLIFLDWNDPEAKGVLTGKLFEYVFSGTPILGIGGTVKSVAGQLMTDLGVGSPMGNSSEKIQFFIESVLNKKPINYQPQHKDIQNFTRQNLANKMLDAIVTQMNQ
jgi:hypothetical protein